MKYWDQAKTRVDITLSSFTPDKQFPKKTDNTSPEMVNSRSGWASP